MLRFPAARETLGKNAGLTWTICKVLSLPDSTEVHGLGLGFFRVSNFELSAVHFVLFS